MVCMRLEAKKVCFFGSRRECFEKARISAFFVWTRFREEPLRLDEFCLNGAMTITVIHAGATKTLSMIDQDKEELKSGEKHCLVCGKAKATLVCKVCRDEYCEKCFAETHSHGQLKEHPTIPYLEAKQGWQKMVGRVGRADVLLQREYGRNALRQARGVYARG